MIYYILDYYDEIIRVDKLVFNNYLNYLKFLNYPLKVEKKYLDKLGGPFHCFYYSNPGDLAPTYVAFKQC